MDIINSVILIGRLTADPVLRFIPGSGQAVANFTMAIDKGLSREKQEEFKAQGKPTADFIPVVAWGKQAENCSQYLEKGRMVAIQGSIQTSVYKTQEGDTRYKTEILAKEVKFLEWGEKKHKKEDFSFNDFEQVEDESIPF